MSRCRDGQGSPNNTVLHEVLPLSAQLLSGGPCLSFKMAAGDPRQQNGRRRDRAGTECVLVAFYGRVLKSCQRIVLQLSHVVTPKHQRRLGNGVYSGTKHLPWVRVQLSLAKGDEPAVSPLSLIISLQALYPGFGQDTGMGLRAEGEYHQSPSLSSGKQSFWETSLSRHILISDWLKLGHLITPRKSGEVDF